MKLSTVQSFQQKIPSFKMDINFDGSKKEILEAWQGDYSKSTPLDKERFYGLKEPNYENKLNTMAAAVKTMTEDLDVKIGFVPDTYGRHENLCLKPVYTLSDGRQIFSKTFVTAHELLSDRVLDKNTSFSNAAMRIVDHFIETVRKEKISGPDVEKSKALFDRLFKRFVV